MNNIKTRLTIFKGTILSVLIFFSISFLSVLNCIGPFDAENNANINIGFPFVYYEQFQLSGNSFVNFGWKGQNLMFDCFFTWLIVAGTYTYLVTKKKNLALTGGYKCMSNSSK